MLQDELHNTTELLTLLKARGLGCLINAAPPQQEDTFLLGRDILAHLERKAELMVAHWRDAEAYILSPNK